MSPWANEGDESIRSRTYVSVGKKYDGPPPNQRTNSYKNPLRVGYRHEAERPRAALNRIANVLLGVLRLEGYPLLGAEAVGWAGKFLVYLLFPGRNSVRARYPPLYITCELADARVAPIESINRQSIYGYQNAHHRDGGIAWAVAGPYSGRGRNCGPEWRDVLRRAPRRYAGTDTHLSLFELSGSK